MFFYKKVYKKKAKNGSLEYFEKNLLALIAKYLQGFY